jgi:P4 family phage/plasmid primase-like protien
MLSSIMTSKTLESNGMVFHKTPLGIFLKKYKTTSSKEMNYTLMTGGKYSIPETEMNNFFTLYYNHIQNQNEICLTEKHLDTHSPLLLDFDFKFMVEQNPEIIRQMIPVNKIIETVLNTLIELNLPKDCLDLYLFQRPSPYVSKDILKDGIHIIFPKLIMTYTNLFEIRKYLLESLEKVCSILPLKNKLTDVLDEAVIQKNNWLLYGSTKQGIPAYEITRAVRWNMEPIEWKNIDGYDLIKLFSIRHNKDEVIDKKIEYIPVIDINSLNDNESKNKSKKKIEIQTTMISNISHNDYKNVLSKDEIVITDAEQIAIYKLIENEIKMTFKNLELTPVKFKHCIIDGHHYYFVTTNDKYCNIVKREHRRNSPTQYIQITKKGFCLKCYNEECHGKSTPEKSPYYINDPNIFFTLFPLEDLESNGKQLIQVKPSNEQHNVSLENTIVSVLSSMRVNFPENALEYGGTHHEIKNDKGEIQYIVSLNDNYCPIEEINSESVKIGGQISSDGFQIRSYHGSSYGKQFPLIPIPIDPAYKNILFINHLTINNTTINNIYKNEDENMENLDFDKDVKYINLFPDLQLNNLILKSLTSTHFDIASFTSELLKDRFRCVNPEKGFWYQWGEHRWIIGGDQLNNILSTEVITYYHKLKKIYELNDGSFTTMEDCTKKMKGIDILIKNLKTSQFKTYVVKEMSNILYTQHKEFYQRLNENPDLICFDNGVYDLQNMEFRNGKSKDCISFTTGINYKAYRFGDNPGLELFLQQILPDESKRIYILKLLASCLSGSTRDEKFNIWTGSGGNGKSKLVDLMDKCMGDYSFKLPISLLTHKRQGPGQATPEIAGAKGRRFGVFQEPSENEKINVGLMKELTGGDKISCRGLYQGQMEFKPQFKLILACNQLPEVPSNDDGTWRRLRVCEFTSRFVEEPNPEFDNEFKIDRELDNKLKLWKEDFMGLLVEYYKLYRSEGNKEPSEIMKYTEEYKSESNPFNAWVEENVEFLVKGKSNKSKTEKSLGQNINFLFSRDLVNLYNEDNKLNISENKFGKMFFDYYCNRYYIEKKRFLDKVANSYYMGFSNIKLKSEVENENEMNQLS